MTLPVKLTAKDVCELTGWSRDQLRGVLEELPPYRDWKSSERVARQFSASDLMFFALVAHLEQTICLRRSAIQQVALALRELLSKPVALNNDGIVFIGLTPPRVEFLAGSPPSESGILVRLAPVARRVHEFFGVHVVEGPHKQVTLKLGPAVVSRRSA